jgi:hypothetical protein
MLSATSKPCSKEPTVGDGDEDAGASFEDQILKLVLAALAGKDVDKATKLAEKSIEDAKVELEREEASIKRDAWKHGRQRVRRTKVSYPSERSSIDGSSRFRLERT